MTPAEERAWQQLTDQIKRLQDADLRLEASLEAMRREREDRLREVEHHSQAQLDAHVEAAEKRFAGLESAESNAQRFLTSWSAVMRVIVVGTGILAAGITAANFLEKRTSEVPVTTIHREVDTITTPAAGTVTVTVESPGGR